MDVFSVFGQGTTFLIRVPLTLAIIEGLVVRKEETYFILPSIDVKESMYLSNEPINELYKNIIVSNIEPIKYQLLISIYYLEKILI